MLPETANRTPARFMPPCGSDRRSEDGDGDGDGRACLPPPFPRRLEASCFAAAVPPATRREVSAAQVGSNCILGVGQVRAEAGGSRIAVGRLFHPGNHGLHEDLVPFLLDVRQRGVNVAAAEVVVRAASVNVNGLQAAPS